MDQAVGSVIGMGNGSAVVNNSGQNEAYPSSYQSQDRVIQMLIEGWRGRKVRLRAIDPPDLSPYAPYGGYPARHDTAVPPYEANDNFGTTDYGIATLPDGSDAAPSKILTFPSGSTDVTSLTFYLKVPARYSGDNFQVEATKCNYSGTVLLQRNMGLSAVYTSWKRAFVERDHMYRRGGLLFEDYDPANCSPNCDQIKVYDWHTISNGDQVVIFDEILSYGQTRTVVGDPVPGPPNSGYSTVTLSYHLTGYVHASSQDGNTPPKPSFSNFHSGGVGVISNCDSDPNQINYLGACYFDPDFRDIEQPFDDAYVEFFAPRAGMGAVPYIATAFFDYSLRSVAIWRLNKTWFGHCGGGTDWQCSANNYFHVIAAEANTAVPSDWGWTQSDGNGTYIFTRAIENTSGASYLSHQHVADHEEGHQFIVNPCDCEQHDENLAWCDSLDHCAQGGSGPQRCLMNVSGPLADSESMIKRFDTVDLLDGISSSCTIPAGSCGAGNPPTDTTYSPPAGSIRQQTDAQ